MNTIRSFKKTTTVLTDVVLSGQLKKYGLQHHSISVTHV